MDLAALATIDAQALGADAAKSGLAIRRELKSVLKAELGSLELATLPEDQAQDVLVKSLRLLRLGTHLDLAAAKIKQEGLSLMSMAITGMDTPKYWDIMEGLFGSLGEGETGSSIASYRDIEDRALHETVDPENPDVALKAPPAKKVKMVPPTEREELNQAIAVYPYSAKTIDETGIPKQFLPKREGHGDSGSSVYFCQHPACINAAPSDQYRVASKARALIHVRRQHLRFALCCKFCQHRVWGGEHWLKHMNTSHPDLNPYQPLAVEEPEDLPIDLPPLEGDPAEVEPGIDED